MAYSILIFFMSFVSFNQLIKIKKIYKEILLFISISILIIFSGFRYGGFDYFSYISFFKKVDPLMELETGNYVYEKGFVYLTSIVKTLGFNEYAFIFTISFISLSLVYYSIRKNSILPLMSLFIYFSLHFFTLNMNLIRQGLSISIILFGIKYIKKRDFISYLVIITIAVLFHNSSIIFLPFYFIGHINLKPKNVIGILIIVFIISNIGDIKIGFTNYVFSFIPGNIGEKVTYYTNHPFYGRSLGYGIGFIEKITILLLAIFVKNDKRFSHDYFFNLSFNAYYISILIFIIFNDFSIIAGRGSHVYRIFEIFLIPYLLVIIKDDYIKIISIIMFIFLFLLKSFLINQQFFIDFPYNNILF